MSPGAKNTSPALEPTDWKTPRIQPFFVVSRTANPYIHNVPKKAFWEVIDDLRSEYLPFPKLPKSSRSKARMGPGSRLFRSATKPRYEEDLRLELFEVRVVVRRAGPSFATGGAGDDRYVFGFRSGGRD